MSGSVSFGPRLRWSGRVRKSDEREKSHGFSALDLTFGGTGISTCGVIDQFYWAW